MLKNNPLLFTFFQWVVIGSFLGLGADLWVNSSQKNERATTHDPEAIQLFDPVEHAKEIERRKERDKQISRLTPERVAEIRKKYGLSDEDLNKKKEPEPVKKPDTKPLLERVKSGFWHGLVGHELTVLGTLWGLVYGRHRALKKKASLGQTITPKSKPSLVDEKLTPRK